MYFVRRKLDSTIRYNNFYTVGTDIKLNSASKLSEKQ